MVTDPIADMLVRLVNAGRAKRETVGIPYSRLKECVLEVLMRENLIGGLMKRGRRNKKRLEVLLRYDEAQRPFIDGCRRVSKPGRRLYVKARDVHAPKDGRGLLVLSSPAGVLTHREAGAKKIGGEALFEIW